MSGFWLLVLQSLGEIQQWVDLVLDLVLSH